MNGDAQLNELLALVCDELQLSEGLYNEARNHYLALGKWLGAEGSPLAEYSPDIYPQGSYRIGTTVHPIGRDEYDIDLVVEMALTGDETPEAVLALVERRLRENETYSPMVERLKRCIRLNYAKKFHLDVLPARPENPPDGTKVRVPDRKLSAWVPSNPRGYALWFEARAAAKLEAREAAVDPGPTYTPAESKSPLQLVTQLIKRWRSLAFQSDVEREPRSIVLTTLAASAYQGELSLVQALTGVLNSIYGTVRSSEEPLTVINPTNADEVLSEKWREDPDAYRLFVRKLGGFLKRWRDFLNSEDQVEAAGILEDLFGEVVKTAYRRQAQRIQKLREEGGLFVDKRTGALTGLALGAVGVKKNTFYGEE